MMPRTLIVALLPLALAACGESNRDAISRYEPKMEAMRAELKGFVGTLPALGTVVSGKMADTIPKPVYAVADSAINTAILPIEALDGQKPVFDLLLSSDVENALVLASSANPMMKAALDASTGLDKEFESALATPIVVLYRTVAYDPPRAMDDKSFEGGTLKLEAFVFTRANGKQVASCSVEAASAQNVSYSYKEGDSAMERLETFANSTLWEDAREILSRCLGETTGGVFVFKRN